MEVAGCEREVVRRVRVVKGGGGGGGGRGFVFAQELVDLWTEGFELHGDGS